MIIFTDRNYRTVAVADADTPKGLRLIDDELNESIKTGAAIYQARLAKNHESVANIESGDYVFVPDFRGRTTVLEITEVEEMHDEKRIIAEDEGLELLNSEVGPFEIKGTIVDFVNAIIGADSEWEVGTNELGNRSLTLKYDGTTNQTKRLVEVAGRFDAEVSYSFDFDGNRIRHKYINFHHKRGRDAGRRLEVGKELKDVTRHISITDLRTAIRGVGQTRQEAVKEEKKVQHTKPQLSSGGQKQYWTNSDITRHDLAWRLKGLNATQLNNWIKAKKPNSPFNGQGKVFLEAQRQSGLDARYILAHAAVESAWGTSRISRQYNNYFGIGAFDTNPDNARNFSNAGLAAGIIQGANWIANNYYNGRYKQRTLYSMRHNNGVHEYATAPNWDTAIAAIMKGSERFTDPNVKDRGAADKQQTVEKTAVVETQVEKATNLIGYDYDDGRYFVDKDTGTLCDREANRLWGKPNKYIVRYYESQATSQKTLFDETLHQLQANNKPQVEYDVSLNDLPDDILIGDTVRIIDHDYTPALYLQARLVDVTSSTTNHVINRAKFANFEERTSGIEERLIGLQSLIKSQRYEFDNQPYQMTLESTNGDVFKNGVSNTTLIATLTRGGIDQSATVDGFIWERQSEYQDKLAKSDEDWNTNHSEFNEHVLDVTAEDVELQATFVCSAMLNGTAVAVATYTIKNLRIGIYQQKDEPPRDMLLWGDRWSYGGDESTEGFDRIWKGNRWEDTVIKRDLEDIEGKPGPPGAPGKDGKDGLPGKPGKDGLPSYTHFAYADSPDGHIGFTLTAANGKKYLGLYTDHTKKDSDDPRDYEWSLFKGKDGTDGIPGKPGLDGRTPYLHIAWANSADGKTDFSTSDSDNKKYMGTLNDFTKADSTNPDDYTWVLIKGADGKDGKNGKDGLRGLQGPKGDQGIPGEPGKDGHSTYTHVAYADSASGTYKFSISEPNRDYIGIYVDDRETDSTRPGDYKWTKVKGHDGKDGLPGKKGEDGQTPYFHVAWANSADGKTDFSTTDSENKQYIGVYTSFTKADSTIPGRYNWTAFVDEELREEIASKADADALNDVQSKQQELEVQFELFPSPEDLARDSQKIREQEYYLQQVENAMKSDKLSLEDRINIIEENVGAGKLSIEAIQTYLNFGEEGVEIGKKDDQVKVFISNNALQIVDGDKVVATFANNQTEIVNARVKGSLEFGYHIANKVDADERYTVISPL